jgi:protein-disulfide isomerase
MPSRRPANNQRHRPAATPAGRGQPPAGDRELERQQAERRRQRWTVIGVVGGIVLLVVVIFGGIRLWHTYRSPAIPHGRQPSAAAMQLKDGKPVQFGSKSAPVTMSLYEDFRCPHCQHFESNVGQAMSKLIRSGQLRVKFYPLAFVEPKASARTANAFACAAGAGFGPTYHAGLFDNSKLKWTDKQLIKLGRGIDAKAAKSAGFAGCVHHHKQRGWVDSIAKTANRQHVAETPTVVIDGHRKSNAAQWSATKFRKEVRAAQ